MRYIKLHEACIGQIESFFPMVGVYETRGDWFQAKGMCFNGDLRGKLLPEVVELGTTTFKRHLEIPE